LNAQTVRINTFVNNATSPNFLNRTHYDSIGALVVAQCDGLDGLVDGIITDPYKCKPDLTTILCSQPNSNATSCVTEGQAHTMQRIWADYFFQSTTATDSPLIFSGFFPGSEGLAAFSVTGYVFSPCLPFFC
jgi:feruloyl esterase